MKKHFSRNLKAIAWPGVVLAIVIILVVGALVYVFMTSYQPTPPSPTPWNPYASPEPGQIVTGYSGILYLEVVDSVLGAGVTTSTTTVDVVAAENGIFDFISGPSDSKTQAANPQGMNTVWPEGTELVLMTDCDGNPSGGLDYYPAMYYVKLYQNAIVYELTSFDCFKPVSTDPYKYTIDISYATPLSRTAQKYQASNVYYWNIGKLKIYPRCAATDFDMYLTYNGATLASVTTAGTWVDTAAEITANATLASIDEDVTFQMVGATANHGWGKEFYVVSSEGEVQRYGAVIIVTTAMQSMQKPPQWESITTGLLNTEIGYYKVIQPAFPSKGGKAGWTVNIPIKCTADTTKYKMSIWLNDCQNLANIATLGTTTSVPTAYGFVTSYGVGAVVHAAALTFSSGAGATMQLEAYLTTP